MIDPKTCELPCLFSGARVTTKSGIVRVEDLCPLDRILTRNNGFQQLACLLARRAKTELENAVVIPRGRYLDVCAERDLLLSPHQRILGFENARKHNADPNRALIFAKDVSTAAPARIDFCPSRQAVTMFFEQQETVLVDGIWVDCMAIPNMFSGGTSDRKIEGPQFNVADASNETPYAPA